MTHLPRSKGSVSTHQSVVDLDWSSDSSKLAIVSIDGVHIVAAGRTEPVLKLENIPEELRAGCWHPNGELFAVGTSQFEIAIFKIQRPSDQLRDRLGGTGQVTCLAFSPTGTHLAAGASNGDIVVWETSGIRFVQRIQRGKALTAIVWVDDFSFLASFIGESVAHIRAVDGRVQDLVYRNVHLLGRFDKAGYVPTLDGSTIRWIDSRGNSRKGEFTSEEAIMGLDSSHDGLTALRLKSGRILVNKGVRTVASLSTHPERGDNWMGGIAISPDGRWLAYLEDRTHVAIVCPTLSKPRQIWLGLRNAASWVYSAVLQRINGMKTKALASVYPRVSDDDLEAELTENYSGVMGFKMILFACLSFIPIVVALWWPGVRIMLSVGTMLCLLYHGLNAHVWIKIKHVSSVAFRPEAKLKFLRDVYFWHRLAMLVAPGVTVVVILMWLSQITIIFYGEHEIFLPEFVREILGARK